MTDKMGIRIDLNILEVLKEENEIHKALAKAEMQANKKLQAENKDFREALGFYGDINNWELAELTLDENRKPFFRLYLRLLHKDGEELSKKKTRALVQNTSKAKAQNPDIPIAHSAKRTTLEETTRSLLSSGSSSLFLELPSSTRRAPKRRSKVKAMPAIRRFTTPAI